MAIQKVTYTDKEDLNIDPTVPLINKVIAADMNEIKSVINNNADELENVEAAPEVMIQTTTPTEGKIWINPEDIPSGSLNPITNEYSVATDKGYSCNYLNTELDKKLTPVNLYYNQSGTTGEVSISGNRSDYLYMVISFDKDGTSYSTIVDRNAVYVQLSGVRSNMGYNQVCYFGKMYNISETKITPNQYSTFGEIIINVNDRNITSSTTDTLKIYKVVGYK